MENRAGNRVPTLILFVIGLSIGWMSQAAAAFTVEGITPANLGHNVSSTNRVEILTSAAVDDQSIHTASVRIHSQQVGAYPGTYSLVSTNLIRFTPSRPFLAGDLVTVTLSTNVRSTAQAPLAPFASQFRVGTAGCPDAIFSEPEIDYSATLGEATLENYKLGDLDGDGDLDALHTSANGVILWRNNGPSQPEENVASVFNRSFHSIHSLVDLDGDGDLDAVIIDAVWFIAYNDGLGNFTSGPDLLLPNGQRGLAFGDLDGDGDVDAYSANDDAVDRALLNQGDGHFNHHPDLIGNTTDDARHVALGDLDGDGDLDAFVAVDKDKSNKVWLNQGDASFVSTGQTLGTGDSEHVSLGDLDADGDLDALVINNGQSDVIWLNDGNGMFTLGSTIGFQNALDSFYAELHDLDADGDLDAVIRVDEWFVDIWKNNGSGVFTHVTDNMGLPDRIIANELAFGDLDGNGSVDAMFNQHPFENAISSTLVLMNTCWARLSGRIWHDVNGDGIQDAGEPPVPNVALKLTLDAFRNTVLDSTQSDANGNYMFTNVAPWQAHHLTFTLPLGFGATHVGVGTNEVVDSDVPKEGLVFAMQPDTALSHTDIGLSSAPVSGRVWHDVNANGIWDTGEPALANIPVTLSNVDTRQVESNRFTEADGTFHFERLATFNNYYIHILPPLGLGFSKRDQGLDDQVDSDLFWNGPEFVPEAGMALPNMDVGLTAEFGVLSRTPIKRMEERDADITLTFDADVDLSTFTRTHAHVYGETTGRYDGNWTLANPRTVRFTPDRTLHGSDLITVTLGSGIRDFQGHPLRGYQFRFRIRTKPGVRFFYQDGHQVPGIGNRDINDVGDLNGDHSPDALFEGNDLFLNDGNGRMISATNQLEEIQFYGIPALFADVDLDGDLDLTNAKGLAYRNNGLAEFTPVGSGERTRARETGDLDGDGDIDALVLITLTMKNRRTV